jgi:molecular chaperone DnaK (HSP70)
VHVTHRWHHRSRRMHIPPAALVFVTLAVPLVATVLGALGFRGRGVAIGVDLGTSYSTIAYLAAAQRAAAAPVPLGGLQAGYASYTLPSVIALAPGGGSFLVGADAVALTAAAPARVLRDTKRIIGRGGDDIARREAGRHGGRLVYRPVGSSSGARPGSELAFALPLSLGEVEAARRLAASHPCLGPDGHQLSLGSELLQVAPLYELDARDAPPLSPLHGAAMHLLLTPEAAGCLIVGTLVQAALTHLGHSQFTASMAAVPAEFEQRQTHATAEAFRRAGLRVSRVLQEPTAAAVAYGAHARPDVHFVLVFDMGGGTLDVSLLFSSAGALTVMASAGDDHHGGEDYDDCLAAMLEAQLAGAGLMVLPLPPLANGLAGFGDGHRGRRGKATPAVDWCTPERLHAEAERVKIALSDADEVAWGCTAARATEAGGGTPAKLRAAREGDAAGELPETDAPAPPVRDSGQLAPVEFTGSVSRAAFEATCAPLFARAMVPVHAALASASITPRQIDEVVLVGGSSRLPRVRALLRELFDAGRPQVTEAAGAPAGDESGARTSAARQGAKPGGALDSAGPAGSVVRCSVDPELAVALGAAMMPP